MDFEQHSLQEIAGKSAEQILPDAEKAAEAFKLFYIVVARLRASDGCPWDREQTPTSVRGNIIEEAYELAEAITENDNPHIREETGDLYLLATMVAYMCQQEDRFVAADSLYEGARKLIRRHPHVFGTSDAKSSDQVVEQWNEIKEKVEGRRKKDSILDEVGRYLPPIEKAYKIQKKAAKVGFDWKDREEIWSKLGEEMSELQEARDAVTGGKPDGTDALEEEFGDLLFTVINAARLYGVDPSLVLQRANEKFSRRFRHVEARMKENRISMTSEHMEQMDAYWNEAKQQEGA